MNDNRITKLITVVLVIIILCYLAFAGLGPVNGRIIKGSNDLRTGIDIRGGISAIMVPVYPQGPTGRDIGKDLDSARAIMENRLDAQGIYDKSIYVDKTNNRIVIDIPWATNETEFNPRNALNELGSTGSLTFQRVKPEDEGKPISELKPNTEPNGIILAGEDVQNASYAQNPQTGFYEVDLEFKSSGVDKFSKATGELVNHPIAIFIDEICLSAPNVNTQITGTKASIEGNFTMDEAKSLADKIRFGALPCKLEPVSVDTISPQLGKGSLEVAVKAGFVAFLIVCLFMLVLYRLPGLTSIIALSGLLALQILFLANTNISVTLPGIGGIILSIGMSVDANVIIFERIKEELKGGRTLRASIDTGFKRAFIAILDSNVTNLIVAVILYIMGSGPIKGFGVTLGIGVLFSFFSAITASRMMLTGVTAFSFGKNKWMYGVKEEGGKKNATV